MHWSYKGEAKNSGCEQRKLVRFHLIEVLAGCLTVASVKALRRIEQMFGQAKLDKAMLNDIVDRYTVKPQKMKSEMPDVADESFEIDGSSESEQNARFNGAELSESVLGRDWNSPEGMPRGQTCSRRNRCYSFSSR
jgi:hypothetical protein